MLFCPFVWEGESRRADDLLDLHQAAEGRAFLLVQLHADVADRLLQVGDHDVLQRVDAAPEKIGRHLNPGKEAIILVIYVAGEPWI